MINQFQNELSDFVRSQIQARGPSEIQKFLNFKQRQETIFQLSNNPAKELFCDRIVAEQNLNTDTLRTFD